MAGLVRDSEKSEPSFMREKAMVVPFWKIVWQFVKQSYHLACEISLLGMLYLREWKKDVHTKTWMQMFTAVLFMKTKKWKQNQSDLTDMYISII